MSKTLQKKDTKISPKWSNMGPRTPPKRDPKSCKTGPGSLPKSDLEPRALPDPSGIPFWSGFWCPGPPPGAPGDPQIVDLGAILEAQIVAFGAFPGSNFHPKSVHTWRSSPKQIVAPKVCCGGAPRSVLNQPQHVECWQACQTLLSLVDQCKSRQ